MTELLLTIVVAFTLYKVLCFLRRRRALEIAALSDGPDIEALDRAGITVPVTDVLPGSESLE